VKSLGKKNPTFSFCFALETAGWAPARSVAASGRWRGLGRLLRELASPSATEVRVGLPSAPWPCPGHPRRPSCPCAHGCLRRETLLCCFLVPVSIYTWQALSTAPHLGALADPFLLQKLTSLPVRVGCWHREGCVLHVLRGGCASIMIPSCFPVLLLWERSGHRLVRGWVWPGDAGLVRGGMGE